MNEVNLHHVVLPVPAVERPQVENLKRTGSGQEFKEILHKKLEPDRLKFSSHCLKRLEQNRIQLSLNQVNRLNSAVEKAGLKGARDSCIIMDDMAFIVSVNNRTVITVVDGQRMKENVFTNIDSAVVL